MASDAQARIEGRIDDRQIIVHRLSPRFPELQKNMVVGARSQDSRLPQPHLLHKFEIRLDRANPSGDFGKLVPARDASIDRLAIHLRIDEEFRLPNDSVGTAEPMQQVVHRDDLLDRVRRTRLLPVAKGRIGDEEVGGGIERLDNAIEDDSRHRVVGEDLAKQIGLRHVDKFVFHGSGPRFRSRLRINMCQAVRYLTYDEF